MTYFVYVLVCDDGSFYTGYTVSLQRRLKLHQKGKGAKYTRTHKVVKIVHTEPFATRREAMRRERQIKRMSHERKTELFNVTYEH